MLRATLHAVGDVPAIRGKKKTQWQLLLQSYNTQILKRSERVLRALWKALKSLILEHPICPIAKNNHFLLYKRL